MRFVDFSRIRAQRWQSQHGPLSRIYTTRADEGSWSGSMVPGTDPCCCGSPSRRRGRFGSSRQAAACGAYMVDTVVDCPSARGGCKTVTPGMTRLVAFTSSLSTRKRRNVDWSKPGLQEQTQAQLDLCDSTAWLPSGRPTFHPRAPDYVWWCGSQRRGWPTFSRFEMLSAEIADLERADLIAAYSLALLDTPARAIRATMIVVRFGKSVIHSRQ